MRKLRSVAACALTLGAMSGGVLIGIISAGAQAEPILVDLTGTGFKADGASNTYSKNAGCGNALVDAMDGGLENRWKDNDFCITWGF